MPRPDGPRPDGPEPHADAVIDLRDWELRTSRLAEMVTELTGCEPGGALHAVRAGPVTEHDLLEVVARAVVDVETPLPPRFRFAGYLRDEGGVAHHSSLRRWDRSPAE
jgi:hypothetical protein